MFSLGSALGSAVALFISKLEDERRIKPRVDLAVLCRCIDVIAAIGVILRLPASYIIREVECAATSPSDLICHYIQQEVQRRDIDGSIEHAAAIEQAVMLHGGTWQAAVEQLYKEFNRLVQLTTDIQRIRPDAPQPLRLSYIVAMCEVHLWMMQAMPKAQSA